MLESITVHPTGDSFPANIDEAQEAGPVNLVLHKEAELPPLTHKGSSAPEKNDWND